MWWFVSSFLFWWFWHWNSLVQCIHFCNKFQQIIMVSSNFNFFSTWCSWFLMEKSLRRLVLYYISGSEGAIYKIFLIQMVLTEKCFYYSASTPQPPPKWLLVNSIMNYIYSISSILDFSYYSKTIILLKTTIYSLNLIDFYLNAALTLPRWPCRANKLKNASNIDKIYWFNYGI